MSFENEYIKSFWSKFCTKSDPDRAFLKVMINIEEFVEEAAKYGADNGYLYLYFMADKDSYNKRNNKNAVIRKPFVVVNQAAKKAANTKVRQKIWAINNSKQNEDE